MFLHNSAFGCFLYLCMERPLCRKEFPKLSLIIYSSFKLTIVLCNISLRAQIETISMATPFRMTQNMIDSIVEIYEYISEI